MTSSTTIARIATTNAAALIAAREAFYRDLITHYRGDLAKATRDASEVGLCTVRPCDKLLATLVRPIMLRGQIEYVQLVGKQFADRAAAVRAARDPIPDISAAGLERETAARAAFERSAIAIAIKMLTTEAQAIERYGSRDRTGQARDAAAGVMRSVRLLHMKGPPHSSQLAGIFKLPAAEDEDQARPYQKR